MRLTEQQHRVIGNLMRAAVNEATGRDDLLCVLVLVDPKVGNGGDCNLVANVGFEHQLDVITRVALHLIDMAEGTKPQGERRTVRMSDG